MPFNGLGTYSLPYDWTQDAANGLNISSSRMQGQDGDMATAFNNCITRDGQGIPNANIPWGGFNLTGVGSFGAVTGTFSGGLVYGTTISDGQSPAVQRPIGMRGIPPTVARAAPYTFALTDMDMHVPSGTTANGTVPPNSSVAFPIGAMLIMYNSTTGTLTMIQGSGVTLRLEGTGTTGTRTLARNSFAYAKKVGTDEWVVSGVGVT